MILQKMQQRMVREVGECRETWNTTTLKICKLFADRVDKELIRA